MSVRDSDNEGMEEIKTRVGSVLLAQYLGDFSPNKAVSHADMISARNNQGPSYNI